MNHKKIVFVVAHEGYQHEEYGIPKKLLEEVGFQVMTASNKPGTAIGKDESTTTVDMVIKDINIDDCGGIFFIGGPGAMEHLDNQVSYDIIKKVNTAGKPLGAICISTRILANAGVLTGKEATGWNGDGKLGDIFKEHGVKYINKEVVVDDTLITATGPSAAQEFGEKIISLLQDQRSWG
ncbi:DJ-1/PfpI family protein [Candidatus Dependentiae bacterium]|nr:DJ-1/PfpI family protein [Candidatus Dependentiae bacterium]